jgi:predicted phage terminase large subunit-like protein
MSPTYQSLLSIYQPDLVMTGDQNTKTRFENNLGGYRLATSVEGSNTGEGGDGLITDDPNNVMRIESDAERISVIDWWDTVMSTRLSNPKTGFKIIVQQRSHENDLTGHILAKKEESARWELLILPARYEGVNTIKTSLGFVDPREEMDEPLYPGRFDDKELRVLEDALGSYGSAGQLQQRPAPREGGMFKVGKLNYVKTFDHHLIVRSVRYWDKAASEQKGSAYTSGVLMHLLRDNSIVVSDAQRGRWSYKEREDIIKQQAQMDAHLYGGTDAVEIVVEQEPGSGGKESALSTIASLVGYRVFADRPTGDKVVRADPFAAQVEGANVSVILGDWTTDYVRELQLFPNSKYKDQTDASSGAFAWLNPATNLVAGVWGTKDLTPRRVTRRV